MYDILVVGAGISAATLCERLKRKYKICVLDVRDHLGGNCYDYSSNGARIHAYGPHIFHCPLASRDVLDFIQPLAKQGWEEYTHSVEAEINDGGKLIRTPFPYSKETDKILGKSLTPEEVIALYFDGYSQKMWGMSFKDLPSTIQGRVPKDTLDKPLYFPDQFVGFPKGGYTPMLENMFDGCDIILKADAKQWTTMKARKIVYCGRPDLIPMVDKPFALGSQITYGAGKDFDAGWLEYKTLNIRFSQVDTWDAKAAVLNYCHHDTRVTRVTHYGQLHKNDSNIISTETPVGTALVSDLNPFYPFQSQKNLARIDRLRQAAKAMYPNIVLLGRLAQFKYIDMFQAIGAGMKAADDIAAELG